MTHFVQIYSEVVKFVRPLFLNPPQLQVYNSSLNKSVQCMKLWKSRLVGNATYEELARRLGQIDQTHIAVAYCNFGGAT